MKIIKIHDLTIPDNEIPLINQTMVADKAGYSQEYTYQVINGHKSHPPAVKKNRNAILLL